jgi:hypothetical protein
LAVPQRGHENFKNVLKGGDVVAVRRYLYRKMAGYNNKKGANSAGVEHTHVSRFNCLVYFSTSCSMLRIELFA